MEVVSVCPLRVASVLWQPRDGTFALTVVCKATYVLTPGESPLAPEQDELHEADSYWNDDEQRSLHLASDLAAFKRRADVILVGHAYAPGRQPVSSLMARLVVGEVDKSIAVYGDRAFTLDGALLEPSRFVKMPLRWERASGGTDTVNPVGMRSDAPPDARGMVPVPNLQPPGAYVTSRGDSIEPVGFGPIAPAWPERKGKLYCHAAGWDHRRWYERPLPGDIDAGYFNAAPPDQQVNELRPDERIVLENLHPEHARLVTSLRPAVPRAMVEWGGGVTQELGLRCDTLWIDTDRGMCSLTWRGYVPLDHPQRAGRVVVTLAQGSRGVLDQAHSHNIDEAAETLTGVLHTSRDALPFEASVREGAPRGVTHRGRTLAREDEAVGTVIASLGVANSALPFAETQSPWATKPAVAEVSAAPVRAPRAPTRAGSTASIAIEHTAPPRASATTPQSIDQAIDMTMAPGLVLATVALPFSSSQGERAPWRSAARRASGFPFVPSPVDETRKESPPARRLDSPTPHPFGTTDLPALANWGASPLGAPPLSAPELAWSTHAEVLSQTTETPAPPARLGTTAAMSQKASETQEPSPTEVGAAGKTPAAAREPEIAFDEYPPARCGVIAARLACNHGSTGDVLRVEDLDAARWQRVHEHWLDRIRGEAARSQKKLLSDYDGAYVSALEASCGPILLDDYARLAEAAERGAVARALAERGLPDDAWPHIHRAWIQRLSKDVPMCKRVRAAVDALRAEPLPDFLRPSPPLGAVPTG